MNIYFMDKLRIEISKNTSGALKNEKKIKILKNEEYYVLNYDLDGDAPKQFIKAYFYEKRSGKRKRKPKYWDAYKETIKDLISFEKERNVLELYENEFSQFFIKERNELVVYVLRSRFEELRKLS